MRRIVSAAAAFEDGCDRLIVQLSPHSPPLVQDALNFEEMVGSVTAGTTPYLYRFVLLSV